MKHLMCSSQLSCEVSKYYSFSVAKHPPSLEASEGSPTASSPQHRPQGGHPLGEAAGYSVKENK